MYALRRLTAVNVFSELDKDRSGELDRDEVKALVSKLDHVFAPGKMEEFISYADPSGKEQITLGALKNAIRERKMQRQEARAVLRRAEQAAAAKEKAKVEAAEAKAGEAQRVLEQAERRAASLADEVAQLCTGAAHQTQRMEGERAAELEAAALAAGQAAQQAEREVLQRRIEAAELAKQQTELSCQEQLARADENHAGRLPCQRGAGGRRHRAGEDARGGQRRA